MKFKKIVSIVLSLLVVFGSMSSLFITASAKQVRMNSIHVYGITRSKTNLKGPWKVGAADNYTMHYRGDDYSSDGSSDITYCIEPGTALSDDLYNDNISASDYWSSYDSGNFNSTLKSKDVRVLISRLMKYGYSGKVNDGAWENKNITALSDSAQKKVLKAFATQLLIWEVVVGERDVNFKHISPSDSASWSPIKSAYSVSNAASKTDGKTIRDLFKQYYNEIVDSMQAVTKLPSFASSTAREYNELVKVGSLYYYKLTLTDKNGVLSKFKVSYNKSDNVYKVNKSGNKLEIYLKYGSTKSGYTFNLTLEKQENGSTLTRPYLCIWGDTTVGNSGIQNIVYSNKNTDDVVSTTVKTKLTAGNLRVVKSATDGVVSGISFSVGNSNVNTITKTTDANGSVVFEGLPVNGSSTSYNVTENNQSGTHYVVNSAKTVSVLPNKQQEVNFSNINRKIRFQAIKVDAKTTTSQGDATLAGAKYGLYRDNKLVATYTTDESGKFIANCAADEVKSGEFTGNGNEAGYTAYYFMTDKDGVFFNYDLREEEAPVGYMGNENPIKLNVSDFANSTRTEKVTNTEVYRLEEWVINDYVRIYKYSDLKDGSRNNPEKGATFRMWLTSNGSYENSPSNERCEFTTGEDGYGYSKNLPYGIYTIEQIKGLESAYFADSLSVKLFATEEERSAYRNFEINNKPITTGIYIKKINSETGKLITNSSATFRLYNKDGTEITDNPKIDTNGGVLMLDCNLKFGEYYLEEVTAPVGYVRNPNKIEFKVNKGTINSINEKNYVTVEVKNDPQKACISLTKVGTSPFKTVVHDQSGVYKPIYDNEQALANVKFNVYAGEDIYKDEYSLAYREGQFVEQIITDNNGYAKTKPLYLGRYTLNEIETSDGYILDTTERSVTLSYNTEKGNNYEQSIGKIINTPYKYQLNLKKELEKDTTFNLGMNGEINSVVFGIYANQKIEAPDNTFIPKDGLVDRFRIGANDSLISEFNAILPMGLYYIKELSTHSSYYLDEGVYNVDLSASKFDELGLNQDTLIVNVNNGNPIINKIKYGSVSGIKVDLEGNPLEGALMGLYAGKNLDPSQLTRSNAIMTAYSTENGSFSFGNKVPYGAYTVYEIETPPVPDGATGWEKINEQNNKDPYFCIQFEINDNNVNVNSNTLKFVNKLKEDFWVNIKINKTSESGDVEGFKFKIEQVSTDGHLEKPMYFTTNENGGILISSKEVLLEQGFTYRVSEVENEKTAGYILPDTQEQFAVINEDENCTLTFNFENKVKKGTIVLNKTAEGGSLGGFEFSLTGTPLVGGTYSDSDFTDNNGKIVFNNVPYGTYQITEKINDKSMEYVIPKPKTVVLSDNSVNATETVSFVNVYPRGSMTITKTSPDDNKIKDIEFTVKGLNLDYEETFKTNENGQITIQNLRVGTYEVTEIKVLNKNGKAPYVELPSKIVTIEKDKNIDVPVFENRLKKGRVTVRKTSENNIVEGFKINIKGKTLSGETYDQNFITDSDGYIGAKRGDTSIKLNAGTYTVTEVVNEKTAGYVMPAPVTFSFEENDTVVPAINIYNSIARGKLILTKTSSDNNIEGFSFKVTGETVFGDKYNQTIKTDSLGKATLTDIPVGNYVIEEVSNEKTVGYICEDPKEFSIIANGEIKEISFHNTLKVGTIKVVKTSEDNCIENIPFNIKGTTVSGKDFDEVYRTDNKGEINVTVPAGIYTVSEVESTETDMYILPEAQTVEVQHMSSDELSFYNELKKGILKIIKTSEDSNVSNISFEITGKTLNGQEVSKTVKVEKAIIDGSVVGVVEVELPYGNYNISEFKLKGYKVQLSKEVIINGDNVTVSFYNELSKGVLKVKKTSTDGAVEGFKFRIKGRTDTGVEYDNVLETDERGLITVQIPTGKYTVSEVKNKKTKQYITPKPQDVRIKEDAVSTLKFKNIKKEKKVTISPNTGDVNNLAVYYYLLLSSILGGIGCVISKKKLKSR